MPARRVSNRAKRLRGTFKKSQARPELIYSTSEAGAPASATLNPGQLALLKLRPKKLPWAQARHFREMVILAPWLTPIDCALLQTYVAACAGYRAASDALDAAMRDPGFATPGSAASEQGKLCSRTVMRQANLMITTGRQLGFSPAGRQALGIEIAAPPVEHKPEDGWAELRLISSDKNDERGD